MTVGNNLKGKLEGPSLSVVYEITEFNKLRPYSSFFHVLSENLLCLFS